MHSKVSIHFIYFSFFCKFSLFAHLSFSFHPFIFSTPFFPFHYFLHKHYIQTWKWEKTQKTKSNTTKEKKTNIQQLHLYAQKTTKPTLLVEPKHKDCIETLKNEKNKTRQDNEREEEGHQEKRRTMKKKRQITKKGTSENKRRKRIKWKN